MGIDIQAFDGTEVYAVQPGRAHIIEASGQALADSLELKLLRDPLPTTASAGAAPAELRP